jgi:hypothetical protein
MNFPARTIAPNARLVTCCNPVFDANGAGLELIAYNAREAEVQRDNPFRSRTEMLRVMTRSMYLTSAAHAAGDRHGGGHGAQNDGI